MVTIYTIGHSNHSLEHFLELLKKYRIELVVDVRSQPYSRYVPHFNRKILEEYLRRHGIAYRFLGDKLGGRPDGEEFRRGDGEVDYERWRGSALFQEGIEEVVTLGERFRLTLLCGEEDPDRCHRKRLIGPALREKGIEILHIRGDGSLEKDMLLL